MYALNTKNYVFDLDGTLADSMPIAVKIVLDFLDERNITYPDGIVKTLTPLGFKGIAEYYVTHFGVPMQAEEIYACFQARLQVAYSQTIGLKTNVAESLKGLKARGAKLHVLTASPHIFTDACLRAQGVFDEFENVWSAEDFGYRKSDARIYAAVAEKLGVCADGYVMVDDSVDVIKTAKRAGVKTVGVYDAAWEKEQAELREIADFYIVDFQEILAL